MRKQKRLKFTVIILILIFILSICYIYREKIVLFYLKDIVHIENKTYPINNNKYHRNWDYKYVHNTKDFSPKNKNDLLNIYYTFLNSGMDKFSFYCPDDYKSCISDVKEIANNKTILSSINNYVHPFNSYKHLETNYDKVGKVEIIVEKTYNIKKQEAVNKKVDYIIKNVIKNEKNVNNQIKLVHDYIINNTKYDSNRSDNNISDYDSDTAYGALVEGYALCGGYTDSMAIILDRLGIKNFKIASDNHIWNAVYMDSTWYHLDLTWDDPVTSDKSDVLEYNFFMITTEELKGIKTNYHNYNKNIYSEL